MKTLILLIQMATGQQLAVVDILPYQIPDAQCEALAEGMTIHFDPDVTISYTAVCVDELRLGSQDHTDEYPVGTPTDAI